MTILRCALVMSGALAVALTWGAPASAQQILKFSHTDTPVGARQKSAELFARKVEEYTQGRYKVQVYHSGQLATDQKAIEQLQLGGVDFTVSGTSTYANHHKPLNLMGLPFLVDSYEQGWKFYDSSPWMQAQFEQLPSKGFRILSTWEAGFRSFTTKTELKSPEDAKGRKLRIFSNDMIRWIMESIGFSPIVMPVTEVYLAIQQGTVSGQENPVDTIYSQRFYEVAPHITLTQHVYSPIPLAVAERTWQRLSEADRAGVQKAAIEAADYCRKEVRASEDQQLKEMESKGAKVLRPNIEAFRASVKPVYEKARGVYGADIDKVLVEAEAIRKASPTN